MSKFHNNSVIHVSHIQLQVKDLQKMANFYEQQLGFSVKMEEQRAIVSADGIQPLITLLPLFHPQTSTRRTAGLYHVAFLLPSRKHLADIVQHLLAVGVSIQGASNHRVSEAVYFQDPEGNGIELYADSAPESWEWLNHDVNMASLPFDSDAVLSLADDHHIGTVSFRIDSHTKLGHIHLHVADLSAAEQFYCNGLGFSVTSRLTRQGALFMADGAYHHHIGVNTWAGEGVPPAAYNAPGMQSFTVQYPNRQMLQSAVQRLQTLAMSFEVVDENHYVTLDPSGHRIQLIA